MPVELERKLKRQARKKGFGRLKNGKTLLTDRGRAYVYGALRKTGWTPSHQR